LAQVSRKADGSSRRHPHVLDLHVNIVFFFLRCTAGWACAIASQIGCKELALATWTMAVELLAVAGYCSHGRWAARTFSRGWLRCCFVLASLAAARGNGSGACAGNETLQPLGDQRFVTDEVIEVSFLQTQLIVDSDREIVHVKEAYEPDVALGMGVSGHLHAFNCTLVFSLIILMMGVVTFSCLRRRFPSVYQHNVLTGCAPANLGEGFFSWATAAWTIPVDEVQRTSGLDAAMLVEFCNLCIRILLWVGAPMVFIMCPLHYVFGGHAAGRDDLNKIGMTNMQLGGWLYWVHAAIPLYMVVIVQQLIFRAQRDFLERRFRWLVDQPLLRSSTVLVEGIPPDHRSDERLMDFFEHIFGKGTVASSFVVKDTRQLLTVVEEFQTAMLRLKAAEFAQSKEYTLDWKPSCKSTASREAADELVAQRRVEIDVLRGRILEAKRAVDKASISSSNGGPSGFVTFKEERVARIATLLTYTRNAEEFMVSAPPEPSDIIWADLQVTKYRRLLWMIIGCIIITQLFIGYAPIVVCISSLSDLSSLQSIAALERIVKRVPPELIAPVQGLVASLGLTVFLNLLPTILMLILTCFFTLRAHQWAQHKLQLCYTWFLVILVVFFVALGSSLWGASLEARQNPFTVMGSSDLFRHLPSATHFYLCYLAMQWVFYALDLTRYMSLIKFLIFKRIYGEKEALQFSEPEDQSYHGMGARSARFTHCMVIAMVFIQICPLISVVALVNFAICKLIFSYLLVYAETRKPDLGGVFWVSQLRNLQEGQLIYVFIMMGVMWQRAPSRVATCMVLPALAYLLFAYHRLNTVLQWEAVPCAETPEKILKLDADTGIAWTYRQPELLGDVTDSASAAAVDAAPATGVAESPVIVASRFTPVRKHIALLLGSS